MTEAILSVIMFLPLTEYAKNNDAAQKASEAAYKQSELESKVNEFFIRQVDRFPPEYKKLGSQVLPVVNMIANQRMEVRYEF